MPADCRFDFRQLYASLNDQGIVLYPGAVSQEKSFRIGCIGQVFASDMTRTLAAIGDALKDMGVPRDGLRPGWFNTLFDQTEPVPAATPPTTVRCWAGQNPA